MPTAEAGSRLASGMKSGALLCPTFWKVALVFLPFRGPSTISECLNYYIEVCYSLLVLLVLVLLVLVLLLLTAVGLSPGGSSPTLIRTKIKIQKTTKQLQNIKNTKQQNNYKTLKISTQTEHRECITKTHTHITKHVKLKQP